MTDGVVNQQNFCQFHGRSRVSQLGTQAKIVVELEIIMTIIILPLILTATKELQLYAKILSIFSR